MGCEKELLILGLLCMLGRCSSDCGQGFESTGQECVDLDECKEEQCVNNTECFNTIGSFYCQCLPGYRNTLPEVNVTGHGQCIDVNECVKVTDICGNAANCSNQIGSYTCTCRFGYTNSSSDPRNPNCIELDCASFNGDGGPLSPPGLAHILSMMRNSCLALSNPSNAGERKTDGEALLEKLFTATEALLSPGHLDSSGGVSGLLGTVENAIMLIGPQLKHNFTKLETNETAAEIAVQRGKTRPTGPIHLTNENAALDTDWTTAAGTGSYPGFALAALVSYKNLEKSVNSSFDKITGYEKDGVTPTFQISSKVVSVVVSNPSTQDLNRHVQITFKHLQDTENVAKGVYICAYWDESGAWSTHGCTQKNTSATHTVCTCGHLSSFAVLMALYPVENSFELQVLTKIVLTISLLCLVLCILTFQFCRSIKGTRTTIHLHLCICLFMADLIFLAGISQTDPVGGCRFVAAMLHFFFLGVFTWMLLEGVQLYRMVVLVFNANMRTLYLLVSGYGAPLVIVIISAIIRPSGYGTDDYCWLSLKDGLIWSFFGPVCIIIILNVFFFIVTVWKLAQKFTSLNPDLTKLNKIKAFTVTAIAQMCILGLMWVFGAFLFQEGTTALAYIFTILNGLQGALVFIMHCLLSKQVRDEYAHFLSCICTPQKKRYSDFSSTNPSSSQSQGTRSGQHTGESQI